MGDTEHDIYSKVNDRLALMASCLERLHAHLGITTRVDSLKSLEADTTITPITQFRTEDEANTLWETAAINLIESGVGPANVWSEIDGIFEELALNAAQHSQSEIDSYGTLEVDVSDDGIVYIIGIADGGIGILKSLRANPEYAYIAKDEVAISKATELDVTGTSEPRGAGLHHVIETVRAYRGDLTILSGEGYLMVKGGVDPILGRMVDLDMPSYQGTTVLVAIPIPSLR
jgi:anti-sigma regulatory factor (Ser/Thr protein kinase)